jgi:uncharacterized protein YecA (UPF0149 family)
MDVPIPFETEYPAEAAFLQQCYAKFGRLFQRIHAEAPRPGRNDPCPCGSNLKSKKCCYRQ